MCVCARGKAEGGLCVGGGGGCGGGGVFSEFADLRLFQYFSSISVNNDPHLTVILWCKTNTLFLLKTSCTPNLGKQQEQNCRERIMFQDKTKYKLDRLVHYY